TVVTPSMPQRKQLLDECRESVVRQTVPAVRHLVHTDEHKAGPQTVRNMLVRQSDTEWFLPLDDDDTLDPDCIEQLLARSAASDVVYPFCRMVGRNDGWVPNRLFLGKALLRRPFIPVTALIRRDLFDLLGGYRQVQMEDWDFYQRAWL